MGKKEQGSIHRGNNISSFMIGSYGDGKKQIITKVSHIYKHTYTLPAHTHTDTETHIPSPLTLIRSYLYFIYLFWF